MKTNRIFTYCIVALLTSSVMLLFASCSADSDTAIGNNLAEAPQKNTEMPFNLIVKALSNGEDVTTKGDVKNATLYVFNASNDFIQQIDLDKSILLQRKTIEISSPGANKITVIAWGGLSGESEEVCTMSHANIISDLQVQLKQNNGIAANASDLFYGQVALQRPNTKADAETLAISRKVSSLSLAIKGVNKKYGTTGGFYFFKVKKTKSSFNYNGELTGTDVEYVFPAYFNKEGVLVAKTTPLFPASELSIELYRDNEMIFSTQNVAGGAKASAREGEQTNVVFDLAQSSCEISISPWGSVVQYVTVD